MCNPANCIISVTVVFTEFFCVAVSLKKSIFECLKNASKGEGGSEISSESSNIKYTVKTLWWDLYLWSLDNLI